MTRRAVTERPARLVEVERATAGVALVRLSRAERKNGLTRGMVEDLHTAFDALRDDPTCRAIVLTGAGSAFCVGADSETVDEVNPENMSVPELGRFIRRTASLVTRMQALPQPVIAAVNGAAAGGGFALAAAADVRICSDTARFSTAFTRLGLAAEMGISHTLPWIIGGAPAIELMLTSRVVEAAEARRIGLTSAVLAPHELLPHALSLAAEVAEHSPFAVTTVKRQVQAHPRLDLAAAIEAECDAQVRCLRTEEHSAALSRLRARVGPPG